MDFWSIPFNSFIMCFQFYSQNSSLKPQKYLSWFFLTILCIMKEKGQILLNILAWMLDSADVAGKKQTHSEPVPRQDVEWSHLLLSDLPLQYTIFKSASESQGISKEKKT